MKYPVPKWPFTERMDKWTNGRTSNIDFCLRKRRISSHLRTHRRLESFAYTHVFSTRWHEEVQPSDEEVLCSFNTELSRTRAHSIVYNPLCMSGSTECISAVPLVPTWAVCQSVEPASKFSNNSFRLFSSRVNLLPLNLSNIPRFASSSCLCLSRRVAPDKHI